MATKVLSNGAVYDMETHRIVANPGGGSTAITQASASALAQRRKEKAAAKLRKQITAETQSISAAPLTGSADAVAVAGGMIWAGVVLNTEAYPRDRLDAWERISKHAEVLSGNSAEQQPQVIRHEYSATPELLQLLRDVAAGQQAAAEGEIVENGEGDG